MDEETRSLSGAGHGESPALHQWGPFELRERVGQGGFGEVYRGYDPTLQREVAVKLLLGGAGREQLLAAILREARAMAKVTHPNIVPIYGVKDYDGRVGMWSAFVRGRTLSDLLKSNGPFGEREVVNIGVDLCRALSAVHNAGLLHGDIKANNAMREEGGRILLMDFGLTQERDSQVFRGGTPGYIAPEMRLGESASVRSDIYALGVLLYHLLTAKYPPEEEGASWNLLALRPDLSPDLVRAIHMAIDPDPARRFASAAHMASALSEGTSQTLAPVAAPRTGHGWHRQAAVALGVLAVAGYFAWRNSVPASVHEKYEKAHDVLQHYYRPHAVNDVIPVLEQITGDAPNFAAGFADLGRANFLQFRVLRDTKFVDPAKKASFRAIELDANQAGPHVTLAMLYTELGKNDLATQEIDTALKIDRVNSEAWGARGDLYGRQGRNEDAEAAFRKAVDLDPNDWRWPTLLGILYSRTGRMEEAIAQDREGVRLSPDNSRAYNNLGLDLWNVNRLGDARTNLMKAIELEPAYNRYSNLGLVERELGDYAAAAGNFQKAIDLNPRDYRGWGLLADIYKRQGGNPAKCRETYEKSTALGEELLKTKPKEAFLLADLGTLYAEIGNSDRSIPLVRQAAALEPDNGEILFQAGLAYELLNRRAEALEWIGKALRHGHPRKFVESEPALTALRADKNYLAMVASLR